MFGTPASNMQSQSLEFWEPRNHRIQLQLYVGTIHAALSVNLVPVHVHVHGQVQAQVRVRFVSV